MDDDPDVIKLANKIAESSEENIPLELLHLEHILRKYSPTTKEHHHLKKCIWKYDLLSWCSLALKYDFTHIPGRYDTAVRIIVILCRCCIGINIEESQEFADQVLPDALLSSLAINWQLQQSYNKTKGTLLSQSFQMYKQITESLTSLLCSHIYLAKVVLESEDLLRLLMEESNEKVDFTCAILRFVLRSLQVNSFVFSQVRKSTVNNILDELVYKLSVSSDKSIASGSIKILIEIVSCEQYLFDVLSTRYKGLKAILKRWKGHNFDGDINNLILILESENAKAAKNAVKRKAVAVIVAAYRGWKTRIRVKNLHRVIPVLQDSFRQKLEEKRNIKIEKKAIMEAGREEEMNLRRSFRTSKQKRLEMLKIVPASNIPRHILREEEKAALQIQSLWRGVVTRKEYRNRLNLHKLTSSAVIIQRAVRKFLERKRKWETDRKAVSENFEKLSSDQKEELNMKIKQWQTVNMREDVPMKQTYEIHNKTQQMLKVYHLNSLTEKRINKPHREALAAKLHTENELLELLPKLQDATVKDVETLASNSVAVQMAAEKAHKEMLTDMNSIWWKKLALKDDERNDPIFK